MHAYTYHCSTCTIFASVTFKTSRGYIALFPLFFFFLSSFLSEIVSYEVCLFAVNIFCVLSFVFRERGGLDGNWLKATTDTHTLAHSLTKQEPIEAKEIFNSWKRLDLDIHQ